MGVKHKTEKWIQCFIWTGFFKCPCVAIPWGCPLPAVANVSWVLVLWWFAWSLTSLLLVFYVIYSLVTFLCLCHQSTPVCSSLHTASLCHMTSLHCCHVTLSHHCHVTLLFHHGCHLMEIEIISVGGSWNKLLVTWLYMTVIYYWQNLSTNIHLCWWSTKLGYTEHLSLKHI